MDYVPYIVLAAILFMLWLQLRVVVAAKRREGRAAPDVPEARGVGPQVFYFYSEHCGPCRSMAPLVDRHAGTGRLVKVDVTKRPELARAFGVSATPTFVRVANGTVEKMVLGGLTERRLTDLLGGDGRA